MIPDDLKMLVERQRGQSVRRKVVEAEQALGALGVPPSSEFADFYREYKVSAFASRSSNVELLDVAEPSAQVGRATTFIHEVWELPSQFVCLSSVEGEGAFLYSTVTGEVWDFDLSERDRLLSSQLPARWPNFFAFMRWYLA